MLTEPKERILKGVAASPGVAHGPAFVILQQKLEIPVYQVDDEHLPREIERFEQGLLQAREQLSKLRNEVAEQLGENEAHIFDAHLMVLEDKALIDETILEVEESRYNVEYCFREVSGRFIQAFSEIDDPYLKERVKDIEDVSKRVLYALLGEAQQNFAEMGSEHIVITEDIPPSDAAALKKGHVLGIATDVGSRTSHAVIVARSLGIPAVVGLHDVTAILDTGDDLLVDGYDGLVYINPSQETLFRYGELREKRRSIEEVFRKESLEPSITQDGHRVMLAANIGGEEECELAVQNGSEGVGLYRTEAFFMSSGAFPDEETQFEVYRKVTEIMAPKPVIMRTLDMGGDKQFASVGFKIDERNPFMGFRAIRFCLEHRELFGQQLRAILRASHYGKVKLMFPMISSIGEFLEAKELTLDCMDELRQKGLPFDEDIAIGSMVEVPSAAIVADQLAQHCDFFSIGTNDLIQYLLAVDRINDRIAHLYQPGHPAVLRTISNVIQAAARHDIPTSICGEMAADPFYVPFLIGAGASEISISPAALPEIKYLIRHTNYKACRKLAEEVTMQSSAKSNQKLFHDFFHDCMADLKTKGYFRAMHT